MEEYSNVLHVTLQKQKKMVFSPKMEKLYGMKMHWLKEFRERPLITNLFLHPNI